MERLGGLWCVVVAGWAWATAVLVAASGGVIDLIESLLLVFWGGLVGVLWVGASVAYDGEFRRREGRLWVSVPLVGLAALITAATPLPLAARMLMSADALREYAEGHDPNPPHYLNARWIGAFHVEKVWRHGTARRSRSRRTASPSSRVA